MLVAIAIKVEVVAVSRLCRRLLAIATIATVAMLSFAMLPGMARAAGTGAITVDGTVATRYDAYQLFSATVVDDADADQKVATDVAWANDTVRQAALPVLHDAGLDNSASTAQEAAEWMNADGHMTTTLAAKLARVICNAGAPSVALNAGAATELPCGYWLIVADDDAIAQGEAGTAPIMALVGGSAVTVKPKAATPKVQKHVLEDGTAAWQKAADATVADDLYWRLSATVPAGLTAYDTYTVRFVDTMSAGLDPFKVAASMRVYVAAGADGGFDDELSFVFLMRRDGVPPFTPGPEVAEMMFVPLEDFALAHLDPHDLPARGMDGAPLTLPHEKLACLHGEEWNGVREIVERLLNDDHS